MIGALVFLGCPFRLILRLPGGDLNGLAGILGLALGALLVARLLRGGFNPGRAYKMKPLVGWTVPEAMVGPLLLAILKPTFVFASEKGPGSTYAPLAISLGAGLIVGFLAQRSRLCFIGGYRDVFLIRDFHLASGMAAVFVATLVFNLILGQFKLGFTGQPVGLMPTTSGTSWG